MFFAYTRSINTLMTIDLELSPVGEPRRHEKVHSPARIPIHIKPPNSRALDAKREAAFEPEI